MKKNGGVVSTVVYNTTVTFCWRG